MAEKRNLNASEVATTIAELIDDRAAIPEVAVRDLSRLLGHELATGSTAERRNSRLGLLIRLVSEGGEFIPTTRYEEARREAAGAGEDWPTASNLSRSYGHWLVAVEAAARFWFNGGAERVASSHAHAVGSQSSYEPKEIVVAIEQCQRELDLPPDQWPTQWEYQEWAEIKRRLARRAGSATTRAVRSTGSRWPGLKQIRKAFGTYEAAARSASADASQAI